MIVLDCRTRDPPSPPMWHPWATLGRRPDITLRWEPMSGRLGQWCHRTRTITLDPRQSQAERRSTLTHELRHAEHGHAGRCCGSVERRVSAEAARLLITDEALVAALLWSQDEHELAEELWVDVATVRARLDDLTDQEKAEIERRIGERETAA